tara:strand:+ start:992 stop:1447 length:456 start_codon:yes stop_codon:yes gene_type:complete
MKISELSDTSIDYLSDFLISACMGTSIADGEWTEDEGQMIWAIIDYNRDHLDSDHPALPVANNLRRRVNSVDEYFTNMVTAHSMTERLNPILDSLDDDEANQYAWWVMICCNMVATNDGKRDLQESVYIVDLFRNLGWDYSTALEDLPDTK